MKKFINLILLFFISYINLINSFNLKWKNLKQDPESGSLTIESEFKTDKYIIADSIKAIAMPINQYVSVMFEKQPHEMFIPNESETIMVLNGNGKINFIIPTPDNANITSLIIKYSIFDIKTQKILINNEIELFPNILKYQIDNTNYKKDVNLTQENKNNENNYINNEYNLTKNDDNTIEKLNSTKEIFNNNIVNNIDISKNISISDKIVIYMNNINNTFILSCIIFFLGIIMSFTPCIYPMIPITLGILGIKNDNNERSNKKNIIKATFYVFGIAITFSIMGILAVSGNLVFGGLISKKWFLILAIIIFLVSSLNMMDLLEFHFPQMNIKNIMPKNEYLYSFLYGIISGSITSPCVSPGLFALLTFVAEKGNYLNGFLFLFFFGLGLGFPLWLIAVIFKNLISLPSSGIWMVRIKQIIGITLFYIWISYAKLLISEIYLFLFVILIFIYLIYKNFKNLNLKNILFLDWILYLICFFSIAFYSYNFYNKSFKNEITQKEIFFNDFSLAQSKAISEEKLLLIDFTAEWCSICKNIDKKFFKSNIFWNNLNNSIIPLKVDCTNTNDNQIKELLEKYNVKGFPTILIVNPLNDNIIYKFESNINDLSIHDFSEKIKSFINN